MTRAKAEKIIKGIDNKIRKATVDMEWWADFWGFTVDEYEEFLDIAVKALEQEPTTYPFTAEQIQTMQELESAQVEKAYELGKADRPTGHWIENDNGTFSCSNCQSWIPKEQHHYARHCLYCGARMESKEK